MRYSIEGGSLPVVIIQLDPGEALISEAGGRTWARGPVSTETVSNGGAGRALGRLFMGESLFMSRYTANGRDRLCLLLSRQDSCPRASARREHHLPEIRFPLCHRGR